MRSGLSVEAGHAALCRKGAPVLTRIAFLDVPVDLLDLEQTVARAEAAMASRTPIRHVALNVAKLVKLGRDPLLAADVRESDIVGIDGMGIAWALRLFGLGHVERVPGVDLMEALMAHCARTGRRPYVLGARQDALEAAMAEACRRYPGLEFAGARNGYFTRDDEPGIVAAIRESGADCLFVAMPTPHKERFLASHAGQLGVPFVMGVGGSIDVMAGKVSRAPGWMQKAGLEWFHRLLQEPRKMAWRYVSTNSLFALILAGLVLRGRNPVRRLDDPEGERHRELT